MRKPLFSVTVVAKDESKTLPHLIESLKDFQNRGGEIVVVDTGSTDDTPKIARSLGCKVTEVGNKFLHTISHKLAKQINKTFVVGDEEPVVKAGDRYFDFASARNFCSSLAFNDWVSYADADERFARLDIDKINGIISDPNLAHLEYEFIFSHDQFSKPAIQFIQSKMFNRKKIEWTGIVHEIVSSIGSGGTRKYLTPDIFLLEHWQEPHDRHSYLIGLAVDCYLHPEKDRNSHYMARELLWRGRPRSAIQEFKRHIAMNRWPAERAQSMIYMARAYGQLNQPEQQVEWLNKAFFIDSSRREALVELAHFYRHNNNPQAVACYAAAAMQIPWTGRFYASDRANYEDVPHGLLYWAKGFLGDIKGAQEHCLKALEYRPSHPDYLRDTKYYFEYYDHGIAGWMKFPELQFLYETAKKMDSVVEVGSWMGRSTHALLSGCKGKVIAVDTFKGSADPRDLTNTLAKQIDVYEQFQKNVGHFENLEVMRMTSKEAAAILSNNSCSCVFIDAGHTYEDVREDILAWKDKAKIMLCGHDYLPDTWMGVVRAVDETIGPPDEVHETIWVKYLI